MGIPAVKYDALTPRFLPPRRRLAPLLRIGWRIVPTGRARPRLLAVLAALLAILGPLRPPISTLLLSIPLLAITGLLAITALTTVARLLAKVWLFAVARLLAVTGLPPVIWLAPVLGLVIITRLLSVAWLRRVRGEGRWSRS